MKTADVHDLIEAIGTVGIHPPDNTMWWVVCGCSDQCEVKAWVRPLPHD